MKSYISASLSLLIILFVGHACQGLWPFTILLLLVPLFLKYWLVPGGFAWRNHLPGDMHKLRGPAGWPLLGTLPEMGSLAHRKLAATAASLSSTRLMAFSLGATRVVISSHPDTAREILCGSSFSDRPIKQAARALMFERAIGFAPSQGGVRKYWRHLRRLAATHMFSPRRVASLEGRRQGIAQNMLEGVQKEMVERGSVRLREVLQKGSLRNMLESVFGSFGCVDMDELSVMVEEGYDLITKFNLEDYFPLGFLDFYGVKRRCHRLASRVETVVGRIVEERKKSLAIGDGDGIGNDFLSVLLALPAEDRLCDKDMVAVLWEMIFRGTDTVAILLEWIMARMVLHPEIQAKAQQELDTCVGSSRHVQGSDMPNLPYLQAIVKEVLRMHPPGPLLSWARLAIEDVHVGKFLVPAGTTAMVNMWAITHNPSIWDDPFTFRPQRFIEEDMPIMGSDLRLAPFGWGRRACPGKALGLATVNLWLARLLQDFTWVPQPAQPVDLSECLRLSLEMKKPLTCRAVRRRGGDYS